MVFGLVTRLNQSALSQCRRNDRIKTQEVRNDRHGEREREREREREKRERERERERERRPSLCVSVALSLSFSHRPDITTLVDWA